MPDDNVIDISLEKMKDMNSETKGFSKEISNATQELDGFVKKVEEGGQKAQKFFSEVGGDFKALGGAAGRYLGGGFGALLSVPQAASMSGADSYSESFKEFDKFRRYSQVAEGVGKGVQQYGHRLGWAEAAKTQGLARVGTGTREAALIGQQQLMAGKDAATHAQALKQIGTESRVAAQGLELVGDKMAKLSGTMKESPFQMYESGLKMLESTGTKTGAALSKALGPLKFALADIVAYPALIAIELNKVIDKSREMEIILSDRNKAIGKLMGTSEAEAGSAVRRYAQATGTTQLQSQQSVAELAARGFSGDEVASVGRQVSYMSRKQGMSQQEALSRKVQELQAATVGLSGDERAKVLRQLGAEGGDLAGGASEGFFGSKAKNVDAVKERAQRLWGTTTSMYSGAGGIKERFLYGGLGKDPHAKGLIQRGKEFLGKTYRTGEAAWDAMGVMTGPVAGMLGTLNFANPFSDSFLDTGMFTSKVGKLFSNPLGLADDMSGGALSTAAAYLGPGVRDFSERRAENRMMAIGEDDSLDAVQKTYLEGRAKEAYFKIRRQKTEEKITKTQKGFDAAINVQTALRAETKASEAESKIEAARERLKQAELTGDEAAIKAAQNEVGSAMRQRKEAYRTLNNTDLSYKEKTMKAMIEVSGSTEGYVKADLKKSSEEAMKQLKEDAKAEEEAVKQAQVMLGTRLSKDDEKAAMKEYDKEYNLKEQIKKKDEAEENILKLTAEKEKYEALSAQRGGKDEALIRKIEELKEEIAKNTQAHKEAKKGIEKIKEVALLSVSPEISRRGKYIQAEGLRASAGTLEAQGYVNEKDKALLKKLDDSGLSDQDIAQGYQRVLGQIRKRTQIKMRKIDNEYIGRERELGADRLGTAAEMLAAQGIISSNDMETQDLETGEIKKSPSQLTKIQGMIDSGDPVKRHRAQKEITLAKNKYQTMMGRIQLDSYKFRKEADISTAGMRIAGAQRKGIQTSDIASDLTSEVDLVRNKANEILEIRKSAYEKEVEFTRNYTQMRMSVIQTHYDNATKLEQSRIEGADRRQAGGLQLGRELYGANQRMLGVVRQGWGFQDQRIQEYRQGRSFDENRLAAYGIQTPEAIQRARGIRDFREAERDFKRQKTRRRVMERGQYEAAQGALGEMESAGFDKERLMQSEGGVALLLQAESDSRAYYERQGEGGESQNRQMALIRKQKEFARQRFMAGEKMKQYQRTSMDEQLALAESAVQESAAKGAGEGEGDARLRADYARKLGQAAQLAGEQGRTEDMERLMAKQEKIMEALPEEYKRDFADVQAQMNKHMEVAAKELTAIKGYWEKFFGITEEEKKDEGPKVAAKPEDVEGDGTSPAKGGLIGKIKQTLETVAKAVTESANTTQEAYRKGMTIHIDLNGEGASATTTNGAYNQ